jgi:glycyl-tRNA synthetase beta chain
MHQSPNLKVPNQVTQPEATRTPADGKSKTDPLLLEIGCEEIPARFLTEAQTALGQRLRDTLAGAGLLADAAVHTYSTPRRLVAYLPQVLDRQPDREESVVGPAAKAAFGPHGEPTRAAEAFAAKHGAAVTELFEVETPKGRYVALRRRVAGRPAFEVLLEVLPGVVTGLQFPKSMYWLAGRPGESAPRWVRPVRWLLALLGEGDEAQVVPFEAFGLQASNATHGHRSAGRDPIRVTGFLDYREKLARAGVEIDPEQRRAALRQDIERLLASSQLRLVPDAGLETWIVNSTEWPSALMGGFDERFLKLPREILITVMRDHQHYFAVEDRVGVLQPHFVTVLNRDLSKFDSARNSKSECRTPDPAPVIRQGHERVLRARFADAEFFWQADQRIPLRDRVPMLERVTYHEKLGTYADKVRRMALLARQICRTLEEQGSMTDQDTLGVLRAVQLCKCDLTTQMVQEFTELQGVVGGLYAKEQGEPEVVWQAIYDHYLPQGTEDRCPRSLAGGVVALADKLDSVVSGFSAGLEPTGSSDPFGLRRAGNGVVRLAVESLPGLDLLKLLEAIATLNLELPASDWVSRVSGFLRERTEFYLQGVAGLRYDTVRAVVQATERGWERPADALARGRALERIRDTEDFVALSMAAKRTHNILKKSAKADDLTAAMEPINEDLLAPGPEKDLYHAYNRLRPRLEEEASRGEYEAAWRLLAGLRPQVDSFFDNVLVMDGDPRVRRNRLNLLSKLSREVFRRFADLSQIESMTLASVSAPTSEASSGG